MSTPYVTLVRLGGRPGHPLLVLGPPEGAAARATWGGVAAHLADELQVVAWDLPGHGTNPWTADGPLSVADLAAGVLDALDDLGGGALEPQRFHAAGVGVGGEVAEHLAIVSPGRVLSVTRLPAPTAPTAPTGSAEAEVARVLRAEILGEPETPPDPALDAPVLDARTAVLVRLAAAVGRGDTAGADRLAAAAHEAGVGVAEVAAVLAVAAAPATTEGRGPAD